MNLEHFISRTGYWQTRRGIINGHFGAYRIQDELDELKEETDPMLALMEQIDVLIVTAGSISQNGDNLGLSEKDILGLIEKKLQINATKYQVEWFDQMGTEKAIEYSRHVWSLEQGEMGKPNDVY